MQIDSLHAVTSYRFAKSLRHPPGSQAQDPLIERMAMRRQSLNLPNIFSALLVVM
jgi:hypothetical protein